MVGGTATPNLGISFSDFRKLGSILTTPLYIFSDQVALNDGTSTAGQRCERRLSIEIAQIPPKKL
jgi:hypothetical protein